MLHVLDRTADLMEESAFINGDKGPELVIRPMIMNVKSELERTALIIVDVQRDFCPPPTAGAEGWGALAVPNGSEVVEVINELRNSIDFGCVVLTQDWHDRGHKALASSYINQKAFEVITIEYPDGKRIQQVLWPDHCITNTPGSQFHPDLLRREKDYVVQKGTDINIDSYSAFCNNIHSEYTALNPYLESQKISRLVVVGLAYDYCVGLTAIDGRSLGFEVIVYKPACRSVNVTETEPKMTELLKMLNITVDETSTVAELKNSLGKKVIKPLPRVGEGASWVQLLRIGA